MSDKQFKKWQKPIIPAIGEAKITKTTIWGQNWQKKKKKVEDYISTNKPGMVASTYNPSYVGSIGGRITVWGWHRQKNKTLCEK
jgi:hypothetical protein